MDTVSDALCATMAGPTEDVNLFSFLDNTVAPVHLSLDTSTTDQVAWALGYGFDQAEATRPRSFQFGAENNDHLFDFALAPELDAQWCYPAENGPDGESANHGSAHVPNASSKSSSRGLPFDGHPTLSASSDPFASSSFAAGSFESYISWDNYSSAPVFSFGGLETSRFSGNVSSTPSVNHQSDRTSVETEQSVIATRQNIAISSDDRTDLGPYAVFDQEELTQFPSMLRGWTYREVLEIVVFPPPNAPHRWHARVSQLAAELGMPSGSTGQDVITFLIHVATVKNELDQVVPLAKAIAAAARILEGRNIVSSELQSMAVNLYPDAARAYGWKPAIQNTAENGHYDEILLATSEERLSSVSPSGDGRKEEKVTGGEEKDEPVSNCPRFRVAERDLYCRIGACLASFKDPSVCMKHRERHFPLAWRCPGPCRTRSVNRGRFARDETLKRHLLFPRYESCKEAVLWSLGLASIPASGNAWLAPLRDSPERPWERQGFQLTDLETVKARLRDPNFVALPPAAPAIGRRRRYK